MKKTKEDIRTHIATLKLQYTEEELAFQSEEILMVLEATDTFCKAKNVLIYNNLKDEVSTISLIEKYKSEKRFFLPVVEDDKNLLVREIRENTQFSKSNLGVEEPMGENFTDLKKIDLVIVPGVAFDKELNRIGRGKGYYDRFLKNIKAPKIGLSFEYQLLDHIPHNELDVRMDMIVTENEIICDNCY